MPFFLFSSGRGTIFPSCLYYFYIISMLKKKGVDVDKILFFFKINFNLSGLIFDSVIFDSRIRNQLV